MIRAGRPLRHLAPAALLAAGLSACVAVEPARSPRPAAAPVRPVPVQPLPETAKSAAARAYFAEVQRAQLAAGLLRTDGGGPDAYFNEVMLERNFIRIALHDEYGRDGTGFVRGETPSILRRWESPVRLALEFGPSVPPDRQATDRARVASYLARLSQITGHPISFVSSGANFTVHVVSEDEREALGPQLLRDMPGLSPRDVSDVTQMPRSTYCLVYAQSQGNSGVYVRATAVVRAEHPDLLRQSCFHEEIAQGLGLANDSPQARPSIFNDDEEFALLTGMDEYLLRILYDPALRPGMTPDQAQPIVKTIVRRLMGGAS